MATLLATVSKMEDRIMKIEFHPKGKKAKDIVGYLTSILDETPEVETEIIDYQSIGVTETLLITIIGTTAGNLLSHFISELISKSKKRNITTVVKITETKLIFKIPEDESRLIDHIEKDKNDN